MITNETKTLLSAKYPTATRQAINSTSAGAIELRPSLQAMPSSITWPAMLIANAAMARLPMRLVQRLEERNEPTKDSPAAATVAAPGPWINNSRKMNTSPATKEFFEPGMRTGKKPAATAKAVPRTICAITPNESCCTSQTAAARATLPSTTIVHQ